MPTATLEAPTATVPTKEDQDQALTDRQHARIKMLAKMLTIVHGPTSDDTFVWLLEKSAEKQQIDVEPYFTKILEDIRARRDELTCKEAAQHTVEGANMETLVQDGRSGNLNVLWNTLIENPTGPNTTKKCVRTGLKQCGSVEGYERTFLLQAIRVVK